MGPLCSGKVNKPGPVNPCSHLPPACQVKGAAGRACSLLTALLAQWLTFDLLYPMSRVWVISKVYQGYAQVVVRRAPTSNPQLQDRPPFSKHPTGLLLHLNWEEDKILCVSLCHPGFRQRAPGTYTSNVLRRFCQELLGLNKTPSAGCSWG